MFQVQNSMLCLLLCGMTVRRGRRNAHCMLHNWSNTHGCLRRPLKWPSCTTERRSVLLTGSRWVQGLSDSIAGPCCWEMAAYIPHVLHKVAVIRGQSWLLSLAKTDSSNSGGTSHCLHSPMSGTSLFPQLEECCSNIILLKWYCRI